MGVELGEKSALEDLIGELHEYLDGGAQQHVARYPAEPQPGLGELSKFAASNLRGAGKRTADSFSQK